MKKAKGGFIIPKGFENEDFRIKITQDNYTVKPKGFEEEDYYSLKISSGCYAVIPKCKKKEDFKLYINKNDFNLDMECFLKNLNTEVN